MTTDNTSLHHLMSGSFTFPNIPLDAPDEVRNALWHAVVAKLDAAAAADRLKAVKLDNDRKEATGVCDSCYAELDEQHDALRNSYNDLNALYNDTVRTCDRIRLEREKYEENYHAACEMIVQHEKTIEDLRNVPTIGMSLEEQDDMLNAIGNLKAENSGIMNKYATIVDENARLQAIIAQKDSEIINAAATRMTLSKTINDMQNEISLLKANNLDANNVNQTNRERMLNEIQKLHRQIAQCSTHFSEQKEEIEILKKENERMTGILTSCKPANEQKVDSQNVVKNSDAPFGFPTSIVEYVKQLETENEHYKNSDATKEIQKYENENEELRNVIREYETKMKAINNVMKIA